MSQHATAEMLFHLIPLIDKKIIRPVIQHFKPQLTPIQVHIISIVKERKATMTELANEIRLSKQQLTPIVDKLVAAGFVQREYDAIDRRLIRISLTSSGEELCEQAKNQAVEILEEKLGLLAEQDLTSLNRALSDIAHIMQKLP